MFTFDLPIRLRESIGKFSDQVADLLDGGGSIAIGNNDDAMLGRLDTVHRASPIPAISRMAEDV